MIENKEDFKNIVYSIVRDIPAGFVLTYGKIAVLAGRPQNSRMVGKFLSASPNYVPAHRVVNHKGGTVIGWHEQKALLKNEGVTFKDNGMVNMKLHTWKL